MSFNFKGFGVDLKPSFFIMCLLLVLLGRGSELCVLVFSVTLHESAHILTAFAFGLPAEGITVTPIGQQARIRGLERLSFFRRILVVVAGPAVNCILWMLFGSRLNLALFIFNMLPVYPLDGGRLLHYILGYCLGILRANRVQSFLSRGIATCIFLVGFIQPVLYGYNISLLCIGLYLIKINKREYINMTFAFYRSVMYRSDKKVLTVRSYMAGENIGLKTLVYRLGWDYYTVVYVRSPLGGCAGSISEEELIGYIMCKSINHRLRDVLNDSI